VSVDARADLPLLKRLLGNVGVDLSRTKILQGRDIFLTDEDESSLDAILILGEGRWKYTSDESLRATSLCSISMFLDRSVEECTEDEDRLERLIDTIDRALTLAGHNKPGATP
jgi:hypothetical protein